MKMKPILFNTEMVRAILEGRKTVMRRVVKPIAMGLTYEDGSPARKPPYRPGDILYVRETWAAWSRAEGITPTLYYKADGDTPDGIKWRPSIHMPREAARIFLRVTDVRVERLQKCGGGWCIDIEKEGIVTPQDPILYINDDAFHDALRKEFQELWDSNIKPADRALYGWEANPWVWVIEFESITREEAENGLQRADCVVTSDHEG